MTREEVIKVLLQHSEHWKRLLTENICSKEEGLQTVEAFDMAIKALEQILVIEQIIEGTEYIQEDVIRYKMICEVLEDEV